MRWRFVILTAGLVLIGHWALRQETISWLPLPITAAVIIAFTAERPARYLIGLAIVCELLSSLPAGILTATVLLPWLVRKGTPRIEHQASVSFLGVIAATVLGQLILIMAFDWLSGIFHSGWSWDSAWRYVPWPAAGSTWIASSVVAFLLIVGHRLFFTPAHER